MNSIETKRNYTTTNYQFKILYALGMIFIVSGHSSYAGLHYFTDWFGFHGFHVALFIFCSGYFYKSTSEQNIPQYLKKKARNLLLPLYLWNLVYAVLVWVLEFKGFQIGSGVTIEKLTTMPIWNGHQFLYNMGGWFVISLFLIQCLNIILRKLVHLSGIKKELFFVVLYLFLGVIGNYAAIKGYNTGWYLVSTRMLHLIPFWGLGMFYKNVLEKKDTLNNIAQFSMKVPSQGKSL